MRRRAAPALLLAASLLAGVTNAEPREKLQLYVMPDTQAWAWNQAGTTLEAWRSVAKALCRQRERFAMVLHTGDLVDNHRKRPIEWTNALSVLRELDACRMPYAIAFGNHDYDNYPAPEPAGDRGWQQVRAQLASQPLEKGPSGRSALHPLAEGWFVVTADFVPSKADLDWLGDVIAKRPNARFVLLNHQCVDSTGLFAGPALAWCRELVERNPAIRIAVSGHWLGARRDGWKEIPRAGGGPPLVALYSNYQHVPALAPWGAVLELEPDSGAVCVWSENLLDGEKRHPDTESPVGWVGASPDRTCLDGR